MTCCYGLTQPARSWTGFPVGRGPAGVAVERRAGLGRQPARRHHLGGQSGRRDRSGDDRRRERPGGDRSPATDRSGSRTSPTTRFPGSTPAAAMSSRPSPWAAPRPAWRPAKGGIWVAGADPGRLMLVDPRTNRVSRVVPIDSSPAAVAIGAGSVWVADSTGTVARFDPLTGHVQKFRIGGSPAGIAYADDASLGRGRSRRQCLAHRSARPARCGPYHMGNEPTALAAAGGDVLATVLPSPASHRGGTLTLIASLSPHDQHTDPAVAYHDSHVADAERDERWAGRLPACRRPAGDTLVPDLAQALPAPVSDGLTYTSTFALASGTPRGRRCRSEDFRRAIERVFSLNAERRGRHYTGITARGQCQQRSQSLRSRARDRHQRPGGHDHLPPDRTRPGVPLQACFLLR